MGWSKHCCRLRQSALTFRCPPQRPLFPITAVISRAFADSRSPASDPSSASLKPSEVGTADDGAPKPTASATPPLASHRVTGDLAPTSIFAQQRERMQTLRTQRNQERQRRKQEAALTESGQLRPTLLEKRDPVAMAAVLDPRPRARVRFERRMVLKELRNRGRLSKEQVIKRTERQYVQRSNFYKTGMKKVAPLARQIAGKTIDDAILQMRFSKKKAATWILEHLVESKNKAIVERGMGLGQAGQTPATGEKPKYTQVELRDGTKRKISDKTNIYIAQAWVNKGPYGKSQIKRARGRIDTLRHPQTGITVMLKEEATRIREWQDRVEKEERKKPWQALPNKAIHGQRPYYSW